MKSLIITMMLLTCSIGWSKPAEGPVLEHICIGHYAITNLLFVPVEVVIHCDFNNNYDDVKMVLMPRTKEDFYVKYTWGGVPGYVVVRSWKKLK